MVIALFRKKGEVETVRGKGIFVYKAPDVAGKKPATELSTYDNLLQHLREVIYNGYKQSGDALPPITFLSKRFSVRASTVSHVYHQLDMKFENDLKSFLHTLRLRTGNMTRVLIDWNRGNYRGTPRGVNSFVRGHPSTASANVLARHLVRSGAKDVVLFSGIRSQIWASSWPASLVKIQTEVRGLGGEMHFRIIVSGCNNALAQSLPEMPDGIDWIISRLGKTTVRWRNKFGKQPVSKLQKEVIPCETFQDLLTDVSDADTWIFGKDTEALKALKWAEKRNLKVPGKLQIIGLEDDPSCYPEGISSCVPDWDGCGYQMAHALIGDIPVSKTKKGFIKSRAGMLHRHTTRV